MVLLLGIPSLVELLWRTFLLLKHHEAAQPLRALRWEGEHFELWAERGYNAVPEVVERVKEQRDFEREAVCV